MTQPANRRWIPQARRTLIELRADGAGWGYRPRSEPAVEPTVLASLGLLAIPPDGGPPRHPAVEAAARWLADVQQPDGSLGVTADLPDPRWPTPLAVLLWHAFDGDSRSQAPLGNVHSGSSASRRAKQSFAGVRSQAEPGNEGGYLKSRKKAVNWLLRRRGETLPPNPENPGSDDTTIPGWPWVAATYSWLEPTAMAVLALAAEDLPQHPRTLDGLRMIRDRAIAGGGWNYGNACVFGTPLRAQPAPTGLALLALACREPRRSQIAERACRYLEATLPSTRSPQSLCWGLRGLTAWGRRPAEADVWLEEAYRLVGDRPDPVLQLGYLLLASGESLPDFLGDGS